jgi:AhpD family alkylhydroperoxidase
LKKSSHFSIETFTKKMIYIAVSVTKGCSYCIHSHTASAISKGMSSAKHADLMRVIALAGKTNQLASAKQLPIDAVFTKE